MSHYHQRIRTPAISDDTYVAEWGCAHLVITACRGVAYAYGLRREKEKKISVRDMEKRGETDEPLDDEAYVGFGDPELVVLLVPQRPCVVILHLRRHFCGL